LIIPALAREKTPVPAKLLSAKTAFLVNDGTSAKTFDRFYAELKKWNRFQLVENKDQADIVVVLSSRAMGMQFYIEITDTTNNTPLWSDSAYTARKFVSGLRNRMENK
jgi:hypothetical protein